MPQYLVAGYLPDDFGPSSVGEAMGRAIHALNKEMIAAGVRKFACGRTGVPAVLLFAALGYWHKRKQPAPAAA
jgi:hypothetical protein